MSVGPDHLMVAPIVVPLLAGASLLIVERVAPRAQAALAVGSTAALAIIAAMLLGRAESGATGAYLLGNWAAPFGIALALALKSRFVNGDDHVDAGPDDGPPGDFTSDPAAGRLDGPAGPRVDANGEDRR